MGEGCNLASSPPHFAKAQNTLFIHSSSYTGPGWRMPAVRITYAFHRASLGRDSAAFLRDNKERALVRTVRLLFMVYHIFRESSAMTATEANG